MKPCLACGEPTEDTRCPDHDRGPWHHREGSAAARGYDNAWNKLSRRARKAQPFCSTCGSKDDLTTDHLPEAWKRKAEGKRIRLCDVRVLCLPCNVAAGSSRPGRDQGQATGRRADATAGQPQFPLHTQNGAL